MLFLLILIISAAVYFIHDFLCYCFMQEKKINKKTFLQWWYGEIDHDEF